ncbi:MAG: ADP-ribosylglycohydrolase family protein [Bacteroidota bacterium]
MRVFITAISSLLLLAACQPAPPSSQSVSLPLEESASLQKSSNFQIDKVTYQDKILGALVGSAIGDAMGSPVEMWTAAAIRDRHGFIDQLIPNTRLAGAEGPWQTNMIAGTGTDDTRWKQMMTYYFLSLKVGESPNDFGFANFIVAQYEQMKQKILAADGLHPDRLEASTRYLQWMQEWVKVAEAYRSKDIQQYAQTLPKFYGGEMSCAGMLYAPLLGILYPAAPKQAYQIAWELSLFDIGYAKDLTAMTAALSAAAFTDSSAEDLLSLHYQVDEKSFADSRLIGRIANVIYENALRDSRAAKQIQNIEIDEVNIAVPNYFAGDSLRYQQMLLLFDNLNGQLKDIPFHAHEVYAITLYALLYAEGDFMDAMCFVTNFGRDNDTVAAVVGTVLGIQNGYAQLPEDIAKQVVEANKEVLGIDLVELSKLLSERFYEEN